MRSVYPSVDAYFGTLPDGWSSFPACLVNASLVTGLRERGAFDGLDDLPGPIARHITGGALGPAWIPEVLVVGGFLAVRDARFGGPSGELEFLAWVDALNHEILDAQQSDASVATPEDALRFIPEVWSRFHRGTTITLVARATRSAELAFAHPPLLFPASWMEARRRTVASALTRAGAVRLEVRAEPDRDRGTRFQLSWT